jgi:3-oxoacyl-[acyl-carrier-protein] synthase III
MNFTFRRERISGLLGRDEFDALILVTQSPDHSMPPTSSIIQGRLNLKHDLFCLDINQGCRKGHLRLSA